MAVAAVHGSSFSSAWRIVNLLRPGNLVMTALAVATGAFIVDPEPAAQQFWLTVAASICIAAFGNLLNDLLDVELDKTAHPERALPGGLVKQSTVRLVAVALLLGGLVLAAVAHWSLLLFAILNAGILVLYEGRWKAAGLPGNLLVAWLVASAFLFGGVAVASGLPSHGMLWLLAAMAALTTAAREILKDIEDLEADRAHRRTFPLRVGTAPARVLAFLLVQAAVLLSLVAFLQGPDWSRWWLVGLGLADAAFIVAVCLAWLDVNVAQRGVKAAMLLALLSFLFGALVPASTW